MNTKKEGKPVGAVITDRRYCLIKMGVTLQNIMMSFKHGKGPNRLMRIIVGKYLSTAYSGYSANIH